MKATNQYFHTMLLDCQLRNEELTEIIKVGVETLEILFRTELSVLPENPAISIGTMADSRQ